MILLIYEWMNSHCLSGLVGRGDLVGGTELGNSLHHCSRKIWAQLLSLWLVLYISGQAGQAADLTDRMDIAIQLPRFRRSFWKSFFPSRIFDQHFGEHVSESDVLAAYSPRPSLFRWPSWMDSGHSEVRTRCWCLCFGCAKAAPSNVTTGSGSRTLF